MKTKVNLNTIFRTAVLSCGVLLTHACTYAQSGEPKPKMHINITKETDGMKTITMDTAIALDGFSLDQILDAKGIFFSGDSLKGLGNLKIQLDGKDGIPTPEALMALIRSRQLPMRGCDSASLHALLKELPQIVTQHLNGMDIKIDIQADGKDGELDLEGLLKQLESMELPVGTIMDRRIIMDSTSLGCTDAGKQPKMIREVRIVVINTRMEELSADDKKTLREIQPSLKPKHINTLPAEDLNVYPNPNQGRFRLRFSLPEKEQTTVRIMDMHGKVVFEDRSGDFSGRYDQEIDLTAQPKGAYFLEVRQGKSTAFRKLIMQ